MRGLKWVSNVLFKVYFFWGPACEGSELVVKGFNVILCKFKGLISGF